jgi:hypothetical protein
VVVLHHRGGQGDHVQGVAARLPADPQQEVRPCPAEESHQALNHSPVQGVGAHHQVDHRGQVEVHWHRALQELDYQDGGEE